MSTVTSILDLPKLVKVSREYAMLGVYPESLQKYKSALKLIQQYLYF